MAKSSETGGFSEETKRKLADRAGHHCSLCLALTTCSNPEGKPFRIGDAAHQAAASEGGPRHDPDQSDTERSSVENGLWLCSSCHRKIDGDKYRYSVSDLKQMKIEAEERARRMVHGEIVFEMKDKEHAAIENYLDSRPLKNQLPKSASGAILGVQIVPYGAITDRPRLSHPELITAGVPTSRNHVYPGATPDSKGVFAETGQEVSRLDRDATAQLWINYPRVTGLYTTTGDNRLLPSARIAADILRYLRNTRAVYTKHGIRSPKVITRARLSNVLQKMLVYSLSGGSCIPIREDILDTNYAILDQGEDEELLKELWYCSGAQGLPQEILKVIQEVSAEPFQ
jgi:hypothetical protein